MLPPPRRHRFFEDVEDLRAQERARNYAKGMEIMERRQRQIEEAAEKKKGGSSWTTAWTITDLPVVPQNSSDVEQVHRCGHYIYMCILLYIAWFTRVKTTLLAFKYPAFTHGFIEVILTRVSSKYVKISVVREAKLFVFYKCSISECLLDDSHTRTGNVIYYFVSVLRHEY